ncbi:MAG TPA: putative sulfate exporter family transporter, partial [Anaerolineae bacterium]|nr:putative sulfate exporter family transporter [Anaerolineae bacterium]
LLGLIFGAVLPLPKVLKPGFSFAVKKVLRLGIILLGIRLTIFDVFRLGAFGVPIVLFCILGALFFTTRINKWVRLPERLGTLIAVGTSICGVSAIVATGPAIDAEEEEVAYAVAVITIFGLLATLVYPYLANLLFAGEPLKVGLFLGTSVHDTSQVVGSAKVYADVFGAPLALDVATVTKLVRNVFMAVVIPFMAFYYARKTAGQDESAAKKTSFVKLLPLFVVGFVIMAVIRSIGDVGINAGGNAFGLWGDAAWKAIYTFVRTWAGNLLVVALAGVGLSTDFRAFKGLGIKPFVVGLGAALVVGVVSFVAISLLGSFVRL